MPKNGGNTAVEASVPTQAEGLASRELSADLVDRLLERALNAIRQRRFFPEGTYRLQFHAEFTFRDAQRLTPYFRALGVTHCYASPYLKARPGSRHGYDIINHQVLNPEIGTEEDYLAWVGALREHGLGQIVDAVPNHMAIVGNDNPWWNDVLENGRGSPYAGFFDIDWHPTTRPEQVDRVLLPILGAPYGTVLESQQIRLAYEGGAFFLYYFEHRFPVAPRSYERILAYGLDELERGLGRDAPALLEYQSILTSIPHLPGFAEVDPAKVTERQREKEVIKRRLAALVESSAGIREFIDRNVSLFNGEPGDQHSFDLLDQLLRDQAYRLASWRVASDEINYRRFFDVNELAALSMERSEVFEATHALLLRYLAEGKIDGLRIDHPDGLYDPRQYLQGLQRRFVVACALREWNQEEAGKSRNGEVATGDSKGRNGVAGADSPGKSLEEALLARLEGPAPGTDADLWRRPLYVVVEKILTRDEKLPDDWPVHGTSGYEFLNTVNGVFVDSRNARAFTQLYDEWLGEYTSFPETAYRSKYLIMQVALSSELHMVARQLDRLAQKHRASQDFTLNSLRHALRAIIACFPVYRSYITADEVHASDRWHVQTAVVRAKRRNPAISASIFDFVQDMLLLKYPESSTEGERREQAAFVGKFQQLTAPVMAKGVEDTAFYVYNRLLSLNDVGGDPERFGVTPEQLHRSFQERQTRWPWSLSATSTHDTKRSEDVRARLNVLSELPEAWRDSLRRWREMNERHAVVLDDVRVPDANEEYFFYQTLLGAWPLEPYSTQEYEQFVVRIEAYLTKAIHEAKVHTSWVNPNPAFDERIRQFAARVLDVEINAGFLEDFRAFQRRISHYGLFNSLSQTLLKIAAPGVPDIYQGTETWDFSLVDPDNRRGVDYDSRWRLLREMESQTEAAGPDLPRFTQALVETKEDGRIKLYLTRRALNCCCSHPGLFTLGEYLPAEIAGPAREHVFSFVRRLGKDLAVVAIPRLLTQLIPQPGALPLGKEHWGETAVLLPGVGPNTKLENVFTGEVLVPSNHQWQSSFLAAELFEHFPVALLVAKSR